MEFCTCNEYKMTIYENGVIELEKPYMRKYLEIQQDTGSLMCRDTLKTIREMNNKVAFYKKEKIAINLRKYPKKSI